MSAKTLIVSTLVLIGVILIAGIFNISQNYSFEDVPVAVPQPVATTTPAQLKNESIVAAMRQFATSAPAIFQEDFVCKGGFINEEIDQLKLISNTIVQNRIFSTLDNRMAINQDEAGISCLEEGDKWVLFTALNETGTNEGTNYYCVDSQEAAGTFGLDTENTACLAQGA